jgi:hypothetical protein
MKKLKDLTKEQAIEIVQLIYPFSADVKSDYDFHYQAYNPEWYEDAREYVRVSFKGITFGNTVDNIILEITSILDCWMYYSREDGLHTIPNRNQYKVQSKFIEWGFEPDYTKE